GAFVFYVGGPTAPWEAKAKIFEQRYPGIKISITGGFSNVRDKKIDQQLKDGKLEVDAAIFQTLHDFVRWKAEGQLLQYKPEGFDAIDASFKDPDGAFYGTMVIAMPYMINMEHVSPADVPNSALDFLKPQFRGKAVTPYPADDDATLWLFHHVVQKYGWERMDKYMANKPNFIPGHLGPQARTAPGQKFPHYVFVSKHPGADEKGRKAGGVAFLHRGCDADLAVDRRDLQEGSASQRSAAVHELAAGSRGGGHDRLLVCQARRSAPGRLQTGLLLQGGERLSRL